MVVYNIDRKQTGHDKGPFDDKTGDGQLIRSCRSVDRDSVQRSSDKSETVDNSGGETRIKRTLYTRAREDKPHLLIYVYSLRREEL